MAKRTDGYVDFEDMTPAQQQEALRWLAKTKIFRDCFQDIQEQAFKIKKDGHISRSHKDRTLSVKYAAQLKKLVSEGLNAMFAENPEEPRVKTTQFNLGKEK